MTAKSIRVLIVDDSATARAALRVAMQGDAELDVVGEAADGATATRLVSSLRPDIVTMDVFLRTENGVDVAADIMSSRATPIVIVTACDARDPELVFRAMRAGVLEVVQKLPSPAHADYALRRSQLIRTLKALASVPVVSRSAEGNARRVPPAPAGPSATTARPVTDPGASTPTTSAPKRHLAHARSANGMLLLGASTGGPLVLAALLRALPRPFRAPIAIVQHMMPGFGAGFASWLASDTGHRVQVVDAVSGFDPGIVYLPADQRHLVLVAGRRLAPSDAPPRGFHRPAVDVLFESAALPEYAEDTVAVLFTGMGGDGAGGLLALRRAGATTIAQSPSTCVVNSMPMRAIECGAAGMTLDPKDMPAVIVTRMGEH